MKLIQRTFLIFFGFLLLASCSEYEQVLKGDDYDKKYDMAVKMYKKKKFLKAIPLLEDVISIYSKLSEKGEKAYYYLCYSHYNIQEYALAGYYFNSFQITYPLSEHSEEAAFMSAYCKVNDSPKSSLDQSFTLGAINGLQAFLNRYPNTTKKDTCNTIIRDLRGKLEVKAYESAKLYYKMEEYNAASVAFTNMLKEYPDTKLREEVLFLIVKSNYKLASNSVSAKKTERFEETIKSYTKFVDNFPQSNKLKELESIYTKSQKELNLFKSN